MRPTEQPEATPVDRHATLRQVLTALLSVGVIAAVVGLMSRHSVMGILGIVAVAAVIAVLSRIPAPSGSGDDGEAE